MSSIRRHLLVGSLAAAALLGWGSVAHAQAKKELTIGTTAGSNIEVLRRGIQPQLEKQGYKIKLVEFSDYVQPNHALAQGALDANYFQHIIYLKNFAEKNKLDLVDLVQGPIAPLGLYSKKRKSINELKEGDRIAVPNDPTNLARTFVFLEQFGLVKAKAGVDPLKVTGMDGTGIRTNYGSPLLKQGAIVEVETDNGARRLRYRVTSANADYALAEMDGDNHPAGISVGAHATLIEQDDPAANGRRYRRVSLP